MKKTLQKSRYFLFMLMFFSMIQSSYGQISDSLYEILPKQLKPVDKKHMTVAEMANILKRIGLFRSYKSIQGELDKMAIFLESVNRHANRKVRIDNFAALTAYYAVGGDFDKVIACADSSINIIHNDTTYSKVLADAYLNKGQILTYTDRQEEAAILFSEALKIYQSRNDSLSIGNLHNFQIELYGSLWLYEKAISEARLGFVYIYPRVRDKQMNNYLFANFHTVTASCYLDWYSSEHQQKYLDSVEKHLDVIFNQPVDEFSQWYPYCYFMKGCAAYLDSNYTLAIAYMDSSLSPHLAENDMIQTLDPTKKLYRGVCLLRLGKAEGRQVIVDNLADVESMIIKSVAIEQLYLDAKRKSDWKEALHWFTELKAAEDSTNTLAQRGKVFEVTQKYKVKEKENEIVNLELANINEKKQKTFVSLISVIITLILFSVIISLYGLNHKRKLKALRTKKMLEDRLRDAEELFMQQENNIQVEKNKTIAELQQKISRDMHDGLGNALATLRYYVANKQQKETTEKNKLVLADIEAEVNSVYVQVRDYMHSLNKGLDSAVYDFASFLVSLSEQFSDPDGLHVILHVDVNSIKTRLTAEEQNQMKLIVKEAITNTMKHATATQVMLSINFDDKYCSFNIKDNGKGFSVTLAEKGLGLESIRSRIHLLGGSLFIESFGNGTNLKGVFPLAA